MNVLIQILMDARPNTHVHILDTDDRTLTHTLIQNITHWAQTSIQHLVLIYILIELSTNVNSM
jgi:hypothetical protein